MAADPPKAEMEQYWKSVWEKEATHNTNIQLLVDLQTEYSNLPDQDPDIKKIMSKMKSWTAPGPDMIHTYSLKKLTALHECLVTQMNQLLRSGTHPEWLTQGWTVLIMKNPQRGRISSNYWPITCLSTTWKLLSGIIVAKVRKHMGLYMSRAQKGNWQ